MDKVEAQKLKIKLRQFTGSEQYYFNPLFNKFRYTEGVKYLSEKARAYWLTDYIFSSQSKKSLMNEHFQVWKLQVQKDNSAIIDVEDGDHNKLARFRIPFTDFPLPKIDLWLIDHVLILPNEY